MIQNEKAQLYTMEGIASAMLLVLVIIFVLKAAPMTASTASASHRQMESQLITVGQDLLTVLDYKTEYEQYSKLKQAIISWKGGRFDGQNEVRPTETKALATTLSETLGRSGIVYNLEVFFNTESGIGSLVLFWNGRPSDSAVIVSRKIILHDEDMITNPTLGGFITDRDSNSVFYNVLDVRLTLWRM